LRTKEKLGPLDNRVNKGYKGDIHLQEDKPKCLTSVQSPSHRFAKAQQRIEQLGIFISNSGTILNNAPVYLTDYGTFLRLEIVLATSRNDNIVDL